MAPQNEPSRLVEAQSVYMANPIMDIREFYVTQCIGWPVKNDDRAGSAFVERIVADGGKIVITARSLEPRYKGQTVQIVGTSAGVLVVPGPVPKEMPADCRVTGRNRNMLVHQQFEEYAIDKWGDPEEQKKAPEPKKVAVPTSQQN